MQRLSSSIFLLIVWLGGIFSCAAWAEDKVIILPQAPLETTSHVPKTAHTHIHTQASRQDKLDPDHAITGTIEQIVTSVLARRQQPISYLGFSDHPKFSLAEWERQRQARADNHGGQLVVERGVEWTLGGIADANVAHVCVMATSQPFATEPHGDLPAIVCPTFRDLLFQIADYRQVPADWYAIFAHPWAGRSHFGQFDTSFLPLLKWPAIRERFALIEVAGGESPATATCAAGEPYYQEALRAGWWVAPAYGVDNFANEFRMPSLGIAATNIWIPAPAHTNHGMLRQAILQRRVSVRITDHTAFLVGRNPRGSWQPMGSRIVRRGTESVEYAFRVDTPYLVKLVLVGIRPTGEIREIALPKGQLRRTRPGDRIVYEGTVKFVPHNKDLCYYLRVVGSANTVVGLTAPLWIEHQPAPKVQLLPATPTLWQQFRPEPTERIILGPRQRVRMKLSRHALLGQAYRLTLSGSPITQGIFRQDGETVELDYTNPQSTQQALWVEVFAEQGNGRWVRCTKYREQQPLFSSKASVGFEDGQDTDYDDLLIECQFF